MRITIVATGSRGDVEPYVALSKGLGSAAHSVRLLTSRDFASLAESAGVECRPFEGSARDVAQSEEMQRLLEKGNFPAMMARMAREVERAAPGMAEAGLEAGRDADLVIAGMGGLFLGHAIAERYAIPLVQAFCVPFSPTSEFPSVALVGFPPGPGGLLNRASHHLTRQMMWQSSRSADRLVRRALGLPTAPFWGPYRSERLRDGLVLHGYSPTVIPAPTDWGARVRVTGYWFLDPAPNWAPPDALAKFLEDGPPPVYVGFGSMSQRNPEEAADLVLRALDRTGQRGVILSGWGGLRKTNLPGTAFLIDAIPFSWLFPRVAAVVHHGGAGTTAAGLRAGVPSVIVPFFGDQPFWGRRVAQLGVGPAPLPRRTLSSEQLARAIERAVTETEMRQRAAELGARIRAEDGIATAVEAITRYAER